VYTDIAIIGADQRGSAQKSEDKKKETERKKEKERERERERERKKKKKKVEITRKILKKRMSHQSSCVTRYKFYIK